MSEEHTEYKVPPAGGHPKPFHPDCRVFSLDRLLARAVRWRLAGQVASADALAGALARVLGVKVVFQPLDVNGKPFEVLPLL